MIHQNLHVWAQRMEVQQCCLKLDQKNALDDLTSSSDEQAGSGMALVGEVLE